ncbi:hypothetical protein THARTR1_00033 [Trichoderma harzianum]|uniref:Uncharacterized protein n=1 Tax=Trichoderma harzianum TaxID=5544 RepID=A0A2K0UQF9_TRIHA|nr:hypothetical protein THARTR1_00033 [Trichoderma harzianum]
MERAIVDEPTKPNPKQMAKSCSFTGEGSAPAKNHYVECTFPTFANTPSPSGYQPVPVRYRCHRHTSRTND